ncbi:MAG: diguanylate cyclase [Rhodocyclaceae bacterium]|nr:diguanylate cyclase [Rhodocyclaceae bacterium]
MLSIALFVVLDFGTLAFGYQISKQVEQDAVAINLAGRQRMLSQRATKAVLLASNEKPPGEQRTAAITEANAAYDLFLETLRAFAKGGKARGGAGQPVMLDRVEGKAVAPVEKVLAIVGRYEHLPNDPKALQAFSTFLVANNQTILDSMNQLTNELEKQSVAVVSKLRLAQSLAFLLSLLNFGAILASMLRQRKTAERSSMTDILTGLLNRTGIYRTLDEEIAAARKKGKPIGVLLLDLNGFKTINDEHGHAMGDKALIDVSQKLTDWCPRNWSAGRLGGDEFVVICPGVHTKVLENYARELTRYLKRVEVTEGAFVSASVGWASSPPETTPDSLMSAADAMMYSEKEHHKVQRYRESSRSAAIDPA